MTSLTPDRFVDVFAAAAAQPDRDGFVDTFRGLPNELRAALALVALAAADQPTGQQRVADAAGFSRGSAYGKKADVMELLHVAAPLLVQHLLGGTSTAPSAAELATQVQGRDATIAELRGRLAAEARGLETITAYARALHEQLRGEYEENLKTRAERVRSLRPNLTSVPPPEDHA